MDRPLFLSADQFKLSAGFKELSLPWYSDQILPFDITLAFTNEYAAASKIVELVRSGLTAIESDSA